MSARSKLVLALAGACVLVGAGFLARWALKERTRSLPPLPSHVVPEVWRDFRDAPGHAVHVGREGIACTKCHDLANGYQKPPMGACVACHEKAGRMQHALHAKHHDVFAGVADCTSCHNFGPGHEDRIWECTRCHAAPQGELAAVAIHAEEACGNCHHPHVDPSIEPMACVNCHAKESNSHAHKASPENCLDCHQAHGHASGAEERCTQCHEDKPHALFEKRDGKGHERCTSCHTPHAFGKSEVKPCRSCHEGKHVLAEDVRGAHGSCTSCHNPHAAAQVSDATCKNCHGKISPTHPAVASHTCIECHRPHPAASHAALALPCSSCHTQIAHADHDAHGGQAACVNCHKPHAFAKPEQAKACTSCHAKELASIAKNKGHALCLGCHSGSPHAAELASGLAPVACTTCHKNVHPRKEHEQCEKCHEPHSGEPRALVASCGECHARQEHSAIPKHRECLTCHTPHDGGKLAAASCTGCHAKQAAQNHGAIEGGCTKCHGIHADKGVRATPTCTSCHQPKGLPGLHAIEKHQECAKCHVDAHNQGPFSARATCVSCHKQQENHVPEAQTCQGCHVFRK